MCPPQTRAASAKNNLTTKDDFAEEHFRSHQVKSPPTKTECFCFLPLCDTVEASGPLS
jgi:hypothetical protein